MGTTTLSNDTRIDALLATTQWSDSIGTAASLNYSFPTTGSTFETSYGHGEPFAPYSMGSLNSTQQQDFTDALATWSDVANLTFTMTDDVINKGEIRVAFSTIVSGNIAGYSSLPPPLNYSQMVSTYSNGAQVYNLSGDIWLNPSYTEYTQGTQGFTTFTHELGHALGLKHPFDIEVNNSTKLTGVEDSTQYTIMSYTDYEGAGYTANSIGSYDLTTPTTPMLYDILAMQYMYGANNNTKTGDDTYTFGSKAELKTIWDAGGTDTFDLSNQTLGATVDLTAGNFSSIGDKQYILSGGFISPSTELASNNIAIAFNTDIENVIGGNGNDTLTGNALNNEITGGAGNDIINGGLGNDTAIYSGSKANYTISTITNGISVSGASEGIDSLSNIEYLKFSDGLFDALTLAPANNQTSTTTSTIPSTKAEVVTNPTEGDSNHSNYFLLEISSPLNTDASVSYQTKDGTALAGSDYIATSGIATIKAGELSTIIAIEIIGDNLAETDETFSLIISNPVGASFPNGVSQLEASRTIIDDDSAMAYQIEPLSYLGVINEPLF